MQADLCPAPLDFRDWVAWQEQRLAGPEGERLWSYWLERLAGIEREEMFRVFNMGIGYAIVVNPYFADAISRRLAGHRIEAWVIGEVIDGERGVEYVA